MANSAAYREAHREETRAYMRAYYLANQGVGRERASDRGSGRTAKVCTKCHIEKPKAQFTVRQSGPRVGHLAAYCKSCSSANTSRRYRLNAERDPSLYRRVEWPSKLRRMYGITVADYDAMLARQGGGCAICGSKNPRSRGYKRNTEAAFCVDHDHATGRVRGLLCTGCNRAVGLIYDNPATALTMASYLSPREN